MEPKLEHDPNEAHRVSLFEQMEFNGNVERVLSLIEETTNARLMILETWLIIDYTIRQLLFFGLNLQSYRSAHFKPLSDSFERNLELLFKLIMEQRQLLPKPTDYTVYYPKGFFMFCWQNYPEEFKTMQQVEYKFYEWLHTQNIVVKQNGDLSKFRFVEDEWMEAVGGLNVDWKAKAQRLNAARNCAAHSFDADELFKVLGLRGDLRLQLLRKECTELLHFLLGIKHA